MRTSSHEIKVERLIIDFIDQQPIWLQMAFATSFELAAEPMVAVWLIQRYAIGEPFKHLCEHTYVAALLLNSPEIFLIDRGWLNLIPCVLSHGQSASLRMPSIMSWTLW